MPHPRLFLFWLSLAALVLPGFAARAEVTLFVPGGLAPAMEEIAQAASQHALAFKIVSGHSPAQARQIREGAIADIFISADPQWLDFLQTNGLAAPGRQSVAAETRLALIAAAGSGLRYDAKPGESLAAVLNGGWLALGDPDILPAGRFARDALIHLGAWDDLQGHLAFFHHVGMIAAMVERGEVAAGIAFASDAAQDPKVKVVTQFPAAAAPPVTFPMTIVAGRDTPETVKAFDFIQGPQARAILAAHGFMPPRGD